MIATCFEYIIEADKVGFDVDVWVVDAVAYASLSGEVDDDVGLIIGKDFID
jgi:hypothetical protein